MERKVFVRSTTPLFDQGKLREMGVRILEVHGNGMVVLATPDQITRLQNAGFRILNQMNEEG